MIILSSHHQSGHTNLALFVTVFFIVVVFHLITKVFTSTLLCYFVFHCGCMFHLITKVSTLTLLCYFVFHCGCVSSHHRGVHFNIDLFVILFSIVVMQLPCLSQAIYHLSVNKMHMYPLLLSPLCHKFC